MTFLPPPTHGTQDEWHVLIIRSDDDVTWLHPEQCSLSVSDKWGKLFECHTAMDLSNAGYDGLFERAGSKLEVGVWLVHPWVEECRGLDWVEYDGGWEVIRLEGATDV